MLEILKEQILKFYFFFYLFFKILKRKKKKSCILCRYLDADLGLKVTCRTIPCPGIALEP